MKFKIEMTLDIPTEALPELRAFAGAADTNTEAADWLRDEAVGYITTYLSENGFGGIGWVVQGSGKGCWFGRDPRPHRVGAVTEEMNG